MYSANLLGPPDGSDTYAFRASEESPRSLVQKDTSITFGVHWVGAHNIHIYSADKPHF